MANPASKTEGPTLTKDQLLIAKLYWALKRIASYDSPEKLRRTSQKVYGLEGDEAIEMAYDNVLSEAKAAVHGVRPPKNKRSPPSPVVQ